MAENLGIKLTTKLDESKSKEQINRDLEKLESQIKSLNLNININGLSNNIKGQLSQLSNGLNSASKDLTNSFKLNASDINKHYEGIYSDIRGFAKKYNGTIDSLTVNEFFNKQKGEHDIKDYILTLKTAENEIKKIRLRPTDDGLEDKFVTTIDNAGKIAEKTQKQFNSMSSSIENNLQQIAKRSDVTEEQVKQLYNALGSAQGIDDLERVQRQIDGIRNSSVVPNRGDLLGYDKKDLADLNQGLKKLDTTARDHIKEVLKLQSAYKNLEVKGVEVDQVTGRWSATLRKNAKENLVLKGVIDKSTGSLYKQSEAIKQVRDHNMSMMDQFRVAISRVNW